MQISSLVGKRILSEEGRELGYVLSVMLTQNRAKISYLVCADADEEEFLLPARALLSCDDVLVVNARRLQETPAAYPSPVGMPVYSDCGAFLGTVCDMCFLPEGTQFVLFEDGARYPVTGARIGEAIILKTQKKSAPKRAETRKTPKTMTEPPTVKDDPAPLNGLDRVNLLGKRVKLTVYSQDGNILAAAGETITAKIIAAARRENLLLRLTRNTLTNL